MGICNFPPKRCMQHNNIYMSLETRLMTNPENRFRLLIKFMPECYVEEFVNNGLLFMNELKYFKEYEDSHPILRGDPNEGLMASYLPDDVIMKFNGEVVTGVTGKVDIWDTYYDDTNLYCVTLISEKDILDFGESGLFLSKNFKHFGNKAVLIVGEEISIFWNRLKTILEKDPNIETLNHEKFIAKTVKYVDRNKHHNTLTPFNKFSEYKWQYEWRIALKKRNNIGPLSIEIGDISDIAHVVDTETLVNGPIQLT